MVTQESTDLEKRIDKICANMGLTHNKLAKLLEISSTTFYQLSSGRTKQLSVDVLIKFYQKLDINVGWLATGEGEMYASKVSSENPDKPSGEKSIEGILTGILQEMRHLREQQTVRDRQMDKILDVMVGMGKLDSVSRRPGSTPNKKLYLPNTNLFRIG